MGTVSKNYQQGQLGFDAPIGEIIRAAADADVCSARHRGNAESEEANRRTNKARDRARIITLLREREMTCEEVSLALSMPYTTTSGRLAEMKRDGHAEATGERRKTRTGCWAAVLRLNTCRYA